MKLPDELDTGGKWELVFHRLQIAEEDLASANLLWESGQYRGANNRIDAVLSAEGVAFKRHKDTLAYFNKNYVASEIFPRTMGRRIVQAEEIRHSSDYDPFYIASKGGTQKQIETAKDLLDYAKRFIVKRREAEGL